MPRLVKSYPLWDLATQSPPLQPVDVLMALDARFMVCDLKNGVVTLWFQEDPDAPKATRTYHARPDGVNVPDRAEYVGTVVRQALALHVFTPRRDNFG